MKRRLCLGGGPLCDGDIFFESGGLLIEEGSILEAGPFEALTASGCDIIDVRGRLILPGFLNPHHHLYSHFAPGIRPKGKTEDFLEVLKNLWWPLDESLDEDCVYWSAAAGLLESLKAGVTTVFDHHASMRFVKGSLCSLKRAFELTGVRGLLCFETSDRRGKKEALLHLEENLTFGESLAAAGPPTLRSALGLHANFTLSAETLKAARRLKPASMPVHIHCGEAEEDLAFCRAEGFAGPVDRLEAFGLLERDALLAHCVHLSGRDFFLLEESGAAAVSNPESNANNGVGFPDFGRLPRFLIGTDGMTGDVLSSLRSAHLLCAGRGLSPDRLERAVFEEPRKVLERLFPGVGSFVKGQAADIAVLDYVPLAPVSRENLLAHLLFGAKKGDAWLTMVNGEILYREGRFLKLDEEEILHEAGKAAKRMHARYYG